MFIDRIVSYFNEKINKKIEEQRNEVFYNILNKKIPIENIYIPKKLTDNFIIPIKVNPFSSENHFALKVINHFTDYLKSFPLSPFSDIFEYYDFENTKMIDCTKYLEALPIKKYKEILYTFLNDYIKLFGYHDIKQNTFDFLISSFGLTSVLREIIRVIRNIRSDLDNITECSYDKFLFIIPDKKLVHTVIKEAFMIEYQKFIDQSLPIYTIDRNETYNYSIHTETHFISPEAFQAYRTDKIKLVGFLLLFLSQLSNKYIEMYKLCKQQEKSLQYFDEY